MEVKIYRFNKVNKESNIKAFADLLIDGEIIIKGFKLVEGQEGLFLGLPREKGKDGIYYDSVRFQTKIKKEEVEKLLIAKYEEVINDKN